MNKKKIAIAAGAAAAFAVVGGGAAIAADALSREEQSKAVIDDAAEQLGVEPSELSAALKDALKNRLDEAVGAGRLTTEQADELKKRIDSAEVPLLFGGFGDRGFGPPHLAHPHSLEAAASYLGLTEAEVRAALDDGKSLGDVAKAEGKSVAGLVQALAADAEQRLSAAVDEGKLTQAQADEIRENLEERMTELVNREPGSGPVFQRPGFERHGFGTGPRQFREGPQGSGLPDFPGPHA